MARELHARVNGSKEPVVLHRKDPHSPWMPADGGAAEVVRTSPNTYSVIVGGRSLRALVVKEDPESRTIKLRIEGKDHVVRLEDERERLMDLLGLDRSRGRVAPELKAPMPGLVLNVLVKAGDAVKKNDPLLVLEAMKMENVIRAPGDATVAAVPAEQGKPVEKGQLLVRFA